MGEKTLDCWPWPRLHLAQPEPGVVEARCSADSELTARVDVRCDLGSPAYYAVTLRHRGVVVQEKRVGAEDVPLVHLRDLATAFRVSQSAGIASEEDLRARLRASFEDLPN